MGLYWVQPGPLHTMGGESFWALKQDLVRGKDGQYPWRVLKGRVSSARREEQEQRTGGLA